MKTDRTVSILYETENSSSLRSYGTHNTIFNFLNRYNTILNGMSEMLDLILANFYYTVIHENNIFSAKYYVIHELFCINFDILSSTVNYISKFSFANYNFLIFLNCCFDRAI